MLHFHPPVFVCSDVYRATGYRPPHPLSIERIGPVMDICRALGWLDASNYRESPVATAEELSAFHDPAYIDAVRAVSETGQATSELRTQFQLGTMENPVFPGLWQRATTSVGGSVLAARLALEGRVAYHPAGGTHHGRRDRASGFCYFNDPVFAMLEFLNAGLARVAYLDLDAHHGDGVEAAFEGNPRTMCISVHEAGRWPGTGQTHTSNARNYPVPHGFKDAGLDRLMAGEIIPELDAFQPEALVITCGADALSGDPLSSMKLSNTGLWSAVESAVRTCPRAVVLGGGGYNPWTTVRCWAGLWGRLNGFPMPESLPQEIQNLLRTFTCDLVDDEDIEPDWLMTIEDKAASGSKMEKVA